MKEQKLFKSDRSKLRYTIKIEVYENCASLSVETPEGNEAPTYHEIIGGLATQQHHLMSIQRDENLKETTKKD